MSMICLWLWNADERFDCGLVGNFRRKNPSFIHHSWKNMILEDNLFWYTLFERLGRQPQNILQMLSQIWLVPCSLFYAVGRFRTIGKMIAVQPASSRRLLQEVYHLDGLQISQQMISIWNWSGSRNKDQCSPSGQIYRGYETVSTVCSWKSLFSTDHNPNQCPDPLNTEETFMITLWNRLYRRGIFAS